MVSWMLAVGAALFISGIAFIVAAARMREPPAAAAAAPVAATTPVATVRQIMLGVTIPAATAVYESVGTVISARGIEETAPRNDEEWAQLATHAAMLAESGNLLMMPGRAIDTGDWVKMSSEMVAAAQAAVTAAEAKSTEGILDAGSKINTTCDNCHARYQRQ
jgi:hypothetical protein